MSESNRAGQTKEAYDQIFGPFERGNFRELSEQDWRNLIDGKRTSLLDPESWALPPRSYLW